MHSKGYLRHLSCRFGIGYHTFLCGLRNTAKYICHNSRTPILDLHTRPLESEAATPTRPCSSVSLLQILQSHEICHLLVVYLTTFSLSSYTEWYLFTLFDGVAPNKTPNWVAAIVPINGKNEGGGKSYHNWWYTLDMNLKFCFPPFPAPTWPQTHWGQFHPAVLPSLR